MPKENANENVNSFVGNTLKAMRKTTGLTQQELSDVIGVTAQQIYKYEAGIDRISGDVIYKLAHFFGCDVSFFFQKEKNTKKTILKVAEKGKKMIKNTNKNKDAIELMKIFFSIDNDKQKSIIEFAEKIAKAK